MTASAQRRDPRGRALAVVGAAGCALAFGAHELIEADLLNDLPTVALVAGVLLALVTALAVCGLVARRAKGPALPGLAAVLLVAAGWFAVASFPDVSVALHALMTADAADLDAVVVLGPTGRDIRLSGELSEGVASRLAALLDANPQVERIHLSSDGGLVDEGEALRQTIATHKLVTFVPDYCVSACTLAFLGGRERYVMEGGRLGFHAPFQEGLFGQLFDGDASEERAAYLAAGIAPGFVDKAMKVRPQDLWTPEGDELVKAKIVTGVVDRFRFPDSNLDGDPSVAGARDTIVRNFPLAVALKSWRPKALDTLAGWYFAAYGRGLSEGEVTDELKSMIGGMAAAAMASADDETLVRLGRYIDTALGAADTQDECIAIGEHADLIEAESVLDEDDGAADTSAQALLARALKTRRIGPRIAALPVKRASKPAVPAPAVDDEDRACAAQRDLYAGLLRLPHAEAAAMMRAFAARRERMSPLARTVVDDRS